jgi:hypothetical protein
MLSRSRSASALAVEALAASSREIACCASTHESEPAAPARATFAELLNAVELVQSLARAQYSDIDRLRGSLRQI